MYVCLDGKYLYATYNLCAKQITIKYTLFQTTFTKL
jgi:hypothetical protein